MNVIYSTGARFAGGGIGTTAYHAVRGYWRRQHLHRLICGSYRKTDIPNKFITELGPLSRIWRKLAVYDRRRYVDHAYRLAFDHWAARQLSSVNISYEADVLHAWSGYHLRTLIRAEELGIVNVLDRALAHPNHVDRLLNEENDFWGLVQHSSPTASRIRHEIDAADVILIPSEFVLQSFVEEGVSAEKLIQIPFGVDAQKFCPPLERPPDEPFRALFMGNVSVRKGVPYLLAAWKELGWRNAELWIAGRNQLPQVLKDRYRRLSGVRFLGHVDDPVSIFQQAHAFVFPSIAEGSALVNYEAMACGLPVITTFNAGSIVRHDQDGIIIPVRDVNAMAAALERLRSDTRMRRDMGSSGRARAKEYSWERYGNKLVSCIQERLASESKRAC